MQKCCEALRGFSPSQAIGKGFEASMLAGYRAKW